MTKYTLKKDKIQIRKAIFKKIHSKVGNLSSAKYRVFFLTICTSKRVLTGGSLGTVSWGTRGPGTN